MQEEFLNLGLNGIALEHDYISKYGRLLCGGITKFMVTLWTSTF